MACHGPSGPNPSGWWAHARPEVPGVGGIFHGIPAGDHGDQPDGTVTAGVRTTIPPGASTHRPSMLLRRPQWPRGVPLVQEVPAFLPYNPAAESVPSGIYANTWFDGYGGWVLPAVIYDNTVRRCGQFLRVVIDERAGDLRGEADGHLVGIGGCIDRQLARRHGGRGSETVRTKQQREFLGAQLDPPRESFGVRVLRHAG